LQRHQVHTHHHHPLATNGEWAASGETLPTKGKASRPFEWWLPGGLTASSCFPLQHQMMNTARHSSKTCVSLREHEKSNFSFLVIDGASPSSLHSMGPAPYSLPLLPVCLKLKVQGGFVPIQQSSKRVQAQKALLWWVAT
jgi:hypothetical protein